jgi:opacity protein-like surface antigen
MRRYLLYFTPIILYGISFGQGQEKKEPPSHFFINSEINALSIQDQSPNEQFESSKSSLYLQFNTSGLYPSLTDWKNQLHLSDGTHPSGTNIVFGAEGGWVINRYIQAAIGYEFFFTTKVSTIETTGDQINSTYFYGSIRGTLPLESVQNLSLFGSIDVGSLSATEEMENYIVSNYSKSGSTIAYRIMVGAQYFMIENWSIMSGLGYLFGKVNKVTADGQPRPNFSLDLSGLVLRFTVNYHFPL